RRRDPRRRRGRQAAPGPAGQGGRARPRGDRAAPPAGGLKGEMTDARDDAVGGPGPAGAGPSAAGEGGAAPAAGAPAATKEPVQLDEVMLAMDVVDTLRHREHLIARELAAGARDEDMVARLRQVYAAQGIDVPDHILKQGVEALR